MPQGVADTDTLAEEECVPDEVEQPEVVTEADEVEEIEGQPEELKVPLSVTLMVPLNDAVPQEVGEPDTLDEGVSVADTEEQPDEVTEVEPETEWDTVPVMLRVPVTEANRVGDVVIEGLPLGEIEGLPLTEEVTDPVEQPVGDCECEEVLDAL